MTPPLTLQARDVPPRAAHALVAAGVHPLLARLLAARGIASPEALDDGVARLLPPSTMAGCAEAGARLAEALLARERLVVVADYDCDGATACAVALRGLRMLGATGAQVGHVVPDRQRHGYGLSPSIVDLVLDDHAARGAPPPHWLLTVDNGIASDAGIAHAKARGLKVLVTDHHLPAHDADTGAVRLPPADVIVNPNQPGCAFESKSIAGVGVVFYVLLATRAALRARGVFDATTQPRLEPLLDLVALGTVADVVKLDDNNRRLVALGLKRMRAGRMQPGVAALFEVAARDARRASAFDLGFALGPRINAAGRLADMSLGIACLTEDDPMRAIELAQQLDAVNRERRAVEAEMNAAAETQVAEILAHGLAGSGDDAAGDTAVATARPSAAVGRDTVADVVFDAPPPSGAARGTTVVLFDEGFHEGVVGIVAGRLKERLHRPTFVFARGQDGLLKGSGRSIAGFHLRDALDLVAKRHPGVLVRFGGHAMAAGCTLAERDLATFRAALDAVGAAWLSPDKLARRLRTDGPLGAEWFNPATVAAIDAQVWGQGFEAPLFSDAVEVVQQRLVGTRHLKLRVRVASLGAALHDAIWFGRTEPLPPRATLAYRLSVDEFQGRQRMQLVVEGGVWPAADAATGAPVAGNARPPG